MSATGTRPQIAAALANLIRWLETGTAPAELFAPNAFADVSLPHWRIQAGTGEQIRSVRASSHPFPGQVRVERIEQTEHGFTVEFEERWCHDGQRWYCREMIRADVGDDRITELAVYCTGDWDEATQRAHAEAVQLLRP